MKSGKYEYQTEFVRAWVAQREEARRQGFEEGYREGYREGMRTGLFIVLDARGLEVDGEARQRIQACEDADQLKAWVRKAVTVASIQGLFEASSS